MTLKPILLGTALTGLFLSPAIAQIAPASETDEIIVTALRSVPFEDVTTSITILDEADLSIRQSPYIADQLRAVPGAAISRSGAIGGLTQLRLRGAEANHTLVLLNGVEVSDPATGETDLGLWSGLNVSRIEIARGEQSVLYGSDAIGGVVSITTDTKDALYVAAEYGSFDTFRAQAGLTQQVEGLNFGLSASAFRTSGVDTAGLGGEKDGSDNLSLSGFADLSVSDDWKIGAFGTYRESTSEFDSDTDFDGLLNNVDTQTNAVQTILSANVNGQTGRVDHILRVSFADTVLETENNGDFQNETTGQRTKLSYSPSISFKQSGNGFTLSALADWEKETFERKDINTFFGDPNQAQTFQTYGLGTEARATIGQMALNGSVRVDDNDGRFKNATTWRIGGAYNFNFGGKLRASLGEGVKNPTFTELFGFFPGSFVGNPDLVPEQSQSWEIGYDHPFDNLTASITYFDAALEDEIVTRFDSNFNSTPANLAGDSQRSGIEIGAKWDVSESLSLSGQLSKISSENDTGSDEIRISEWTGSVAINWNSPKKDGFRLGAAADFVGKQDDFNFGTFPADRVTLDSYVLLSATAEYPILDNLALTLRGENLLDEKTTDVFGYNGTGAGLFVGFKIK